MGLFFGIKYAEFTKVMLHLVRKNEANCTLLWAMRRSPGVLCCYFSIPFLCDGVLSFFKFQTYPLVCIEKVVRYFGSRNIPFFNFTLQTSKVPELKTLHHCHIFWLLDLISIFLIFFQGLIFADALKTRGSFRVKIQFLCFIWTPAVTYGIWQQW